MGLKMARHLVTRSIGKFLCLIIGICVRCLNAIGQDGPKISHRTSPKNEAYPTGQSLEIAQRPLISKCLENGHGGGFQGDASGRSLEGVTLPSWTKEVQAFLHNQLSDHTRRAYENDLKQFFKFLEGRFDPMEPRSILAEHVILFRKYLEEGRLTGKVMAKASINRKLAVVKSFLNWLKLNRYVSENPAELVKGFPQTQESSLKGLSDDEASKILNLPNLNAKSGALHGAILSVLLYLGLRKGELIGLKVGDLDEERGISVLKVRGKGHRVRILPLTERVRLALVHYFEICRRDWNHKEQPLFCPTKNPLGGELTKPLNPNAITYIVGRYAKKAGILKPISPHSCRATCISNALDRRATHRSVQHLAGWSTPLMIQRYDKRREDLKNSAAFLIEYAQQAPSEAKSVEEG